MNTSRIARENQSIRRASRAKIVGSCQNAPRIARGSHSIRRSSRAENQALSEGIQMSIPDVHIVGLLAKPIHTRRD